MAPNDFYLIVSPDPVTNPQGAEDAAGVRYFYIKFGDGLGGTRYSTHNPSYNLAQNNRTAGSGTYGIPNVVHGYDGTRVGTFFENNILKACNLTQVGNTEWYAIRPGPVATIAQLQAWLMNKLVTFPLEQFDGDNNGTSDENAWRWIQAVVLDINNRGYN